MSRARFEVRYVCASGLLVLADSHRMFAEALRTADAYLAEFGAPCLILDTWLDDCDRTDDRIVWRHEGASFGPFYRTPSGELAALPPEGDDRPFVSPDYVPTCEPFPFEYEPIPCAPTVVCGNWTRENADEPRTMIGMGVQS
jgi:hypothetical protein